MQISPALFLLSLTKVIWRFLIVGSAMILAASLVSLTLVKRCLWMCQRLGLLGGPCRALTIQHAVLIMAQRDGEEMGFVSFIGRARSRSDDRQCEALLCACVVSAVQEVMF